SLRFVADDLDLFACLHNTHRIVPSDDGGVQLRMEAIEAPELHYEGDAIRQPLAAQARDALLDAVGFSDVTFPGDANVLVSGSTPERVSGAVLSKAADVHGRPIAYVLVADRAETIDDGGTVEVDEGLLSNTLNFRLVETGEAYCLLYTSNPLSHRQILRTVARKASAASTGRTPSQTSPCAPRGIMARRAAHRAQALPPLHGLPARSREGFQRHAAAVARVETGGERQGRSLRGSGAFQRPDLGGAQRPGAPRERRDLRADEGSEPDLYREVTCTRMREHPHSARSSVLSRSAVECLP
ncbi:MAG: hypothetical protein M3317_07005, partial [Actinomycetota bacterium]|nr:hypothetical protein [Actinomycetota bacterium]